MKPKKKSPYRKAGVMETRLVCDRMWGRRTCDWFTTVFPQYQGKELVFASNRLVDIDPAVFAWLSVNGKI
jgi:hypothetical protein